MNIQENILRILSNCRIENNIIFLPQIQLDRKIYLAVNKHFEHIGGKWNKKAKGHVFDSDPTDSFENMLLTGETTDFKKEFQFFETPPELARKMVEMLDIEEDNDILEPSAGRGAIIDCISTLPIGALVFALDINPDNCEILIKNGASIVHEGDFLIYDFGLNVKWNRIIYQNEGGTRRTVLIKDFLYILRITSSKLVSEEGGKQELLRAHDYPEIINYRK